jgi:platelet-activating factor acetylhydrolase IB subunit alpha
MIAYLTSVNLSSSAAALREELQIGDNFNAATSKKYVGLLEKKWTSVVRLQKKVGSNGSWVVGGGSKC